MVSRVGVNAFSGPFSHNVYVDMWSRLVNFFGGVLFRVFAIL